MGAPRSAEQSRLEASPHAAAPWRLWGPYLSARQWGTVREDYSADGDAWGAFPFDQAHRRAYRWGEDGIAGLCDRYGFLNLAVALWNGNDDRLKERLFGLTNPQGNHGEDVKEYWWPLDATPTHSYARVLYRYPHAAYPYADLLAENARRSREDPEYELADTGVFDDNRFFDVEVTHAKGAPDDICVEIRVTNHGPDPAPIHVVPQLWFRNTWAWGRDIRRPELWHQVTEDDVVVVSCTHDFLGPYQCIADGAPELLICDNETNAEALWPGSTNASPFPRDGIDRAIVHGDRSGVNPDGQGTKAAFHYVVDALAPGATATFRLRLTSGRRPGRQTFGEQFDGVLAARREECDAFYGTVIPADEDDVDRLIARRAYAGLLWAKQVYRYSVRQWLDGDPASPPPPPERRRPEPGGRNSSWEHLDLADVISMPDEWEYPWFASWDLAFHAVSLAHVDPSFAKDQLLLMCREWAQHPNGQLPAYEWSFSDVNPPVHAWAAWEVYQLDGGWDREFLVRITTKLLVNFGWWVNRKDPDGTELFSGGFLGMDNISLFDRSHDVPAGWRLAQSDATSWIAFTCLRLLRISQELAQEDDAWDQVATMFLEKFLSIAQVLDRYCVSSSTLWDERDGFYYDVLSDPDGAAYPVRVRSFVGLIPLFAVAVAPQRVTERLADFNARLSWLRKRRPDLCKSMITEAENGVTTLALVDFDRYSRVLSRVFDEHEFLSPHGIRSMSAHYRDPTDIAVGHETQTIAYAPGEAPTGLYGGNSNWRGPVWFPVNYLLVTALRSFAGGAGRKLRVELPTGSGNFVDLETAADDLADRLVSLFRPGPDGRRPSDPLDHPRNPLWQAHPTFSEYFHGDTGLGLGATHQTGWTALVAHLISSHHRATNDVVHPSPD